MVEQRPRRRQAGPLPPVKRPADPRRTVARLVKHPRSRLLDVPRSTGTAVPAGRAHRSPEVEFQAARKPLEINDSVLSKHAAALEAPA